MDWTQTVTAERDRLGRGLSLSELLALARGYKMTTNEAEQQRKSLARGLMPMGDRCTAILNTPTHPRRETENRR